MKKGLNMLKNAPPGAKVQVVTITQAGPTQGGQLPPARLRRALPVASGVTSTLPAVRHGTTPLEQLNPPGDAPAGSTTPLDSSEGEQSSPDSQHPQTAVAAAVTLPPPALGRRYTPLAHETRTHVDTATMCWHLGFAQQTARLWACKQTYPDGLQPIRINGRLKWPVAGIRKILGVA